MDDLTDSVRALVRRHVQVPDAVGDPEAQLEKIVLDSLAVVALLVDLEERFAIQFPAAMIRRETFSSVRAITAAVHSLRASAPGDKPTQPISI